MASPLAEVHVKAFERCVNRRTGNDKTGVRGGSKPAHNKKYEGGRKKPVALTVAVRHEHVADAPDGLHIAGHCSIYLNELSQT